MFWQKNLYLRLQTEVFVLYIEYILNNAQRVLTQVDRDKDSLTYGSCDRNYWHLKIRDFSSAILQQTSLTMALLYEINFENNPYFKNENMREWSISALKYLEKIQLKDGSFNEYYPNEHGYPPTAFILYSACMTYKILNLNDNKIIDTMKRTARYLASHTESKALNQEFAAITGLYLFYSITKEEWAKSACEKKLSSILEKQSSDGWFMEQGGADIGYSSVALDMLCEYYWHSKDKTVLPAIEKLVDFLQYFIHPNKTIGGEYGSRNTTYYMPNGFQTIALLKELPVASKTAETICEYVFGDMDFENHFMNSVDERYLTHYVLHSFLRALRKRNLRTPIRIDDCTLPCFRVHKKIFLDSGLVSFNNGTYFAICGARKGGVLKIFKKNKEVFADFGYRHACSKGKCSATNWLDNEYEITFKENVVMIKGRFNLVKQKVQSPFYHFALRISSLLLGKKINSIAKKILLFSNKHEEIYFTRKIFFEDKQVIVEDYIENKTGTEIVIEEASNFSLRLVASGKFFSNTDLLISDFEKFKFVDSKKIKKCFDVESAKKRIS